MGSNHTPPVKSPFKFLDPYTRDDLEIFFGRKNEVEALYQYVNKYRLVLVYGQSGTGKTSLVQCGLSNRFEVTDWYPIFIRRGEDINLSFRQEVSKSKALPGGLIAGDRLLSSLNLISTRYLRPIYLIFDQFEELLILGKEEEIKFFIETIDAILQSEETASCNLLFVMREEYFAYLEPFERVIPTFSDCRLRVEPLRQNKLEEVILKTCEGFHISLEKGVETARLIIRNLTQKGGISLPYMQVYMDLLWREDLARTYPVGIPENAPSPPPLAFTDNEINEFGTIESVLERFLNERSGAIQEKLDSGFPGVDPKTVLQVLYAFTTPEGTRQPVFFTREEHGIAPTAQAPPFLRNLDRAVFTACLQALELSRLLRSDENTYELAHDSLAGKIAERRKAEEGALMQLVTTVRTKFRNSTDGQEDFLTDKQLLDWEEEGEKALNYFEETDRQALLGFIERNRQKRREEVEELNTRLAEEKKLRESAEEAERIARKKSRIANLLSVLALVTAAGAGYFYISSQKTLDQLQMETTAKQKAEVQKAKVEAENLVRRARIHLDGENPELAKAFLKEAIEKDSANQDAKTLLKTIE